MIQSRFSWVYQHNFLLFKQFRVLKVGGTAKRGRTAKPQELTRKYTSRQKISAAKAKDLVSLCRSGIIPSVYHDYYKSLPSSSKVDDKLADTDAEEESDQECIKSKYKIYII
jgi:hypothetical protein